MKSEKAVLFDLDGTLVDTIGDIVTALNAALAEENVAPFGRVDGMSVIGRGLRNAILEALKLRGRSVTKERLEELYGILMACYRAHPADYSRPYPGVTDLLSRLEAEGIVYGVFSNKADELVQVIIRRLFPTLHFPFVLGMKDSLPRKPDPAGLVLFADQAGVSAESVIYVGDSEVDWQLAQQAKCRLLMVTWGFRQKKDLEKLEKVTLCDTMEELEASIHAI